MSIFYQSEDKDYGSCIPCKPEDKKTLSDLLKPGEFLNTDVKFQYEISGKDKDNFYISEEGEFCFTPFPYYPIDNNREYEVTITVTNKSKDT